MEHFFDFVEFILELHQFSSYFKCYFFVAILKMNPLCPQKKIWD